jgi:DNA-binding NarL/FixJ family response regulator
MTQIRVLIVEDDPVFAAQFRSLLVEHGDFKVPAVAATLKQAREQLALQSFDILAIDLELPDGNGLQLIGDSGIPGKKIVVTLFGDETSVVDAIAAGADGFVLKDNARLVEALIDIHHGHAPLSASIAAHVLKRFRELNSDTNTPAPDNTILSPREVETLQALAMGMTYQETAVKLGISHHTAADHVKNIYRKLAVNSSAAAVYAGISAGLITVPRPR